MQLPTQITQLKQVWPLYKPVWLVWHVFLGSCLPMSWLSYRNSKSNILYNDANLYRQPVVDFYLVSAGPKRERNLEKSAGCLRWLGGWWMTTSHVGLVFTGDMLIRLHIAVSVGHLRKRPITLWPSALLLKLSVQNWKIWRGLNSRGYDRGLGRRICWMIHGAERVTE